MYNGICKIVQKGGHLVYERKEDVGNKTQKIDVKTVNVSYIATIGRGQHFKTIKHETYLSAITRLIAKHSNLTFIAYSNEDKVSTEMFPFNCQAGLEKMPKM